MRELKTRVQNSDWLTRELRKHPGCVERLFPFNTSCRSLTQTEATGPATLASIMGVTTALSCINTYVRYSKRPAAASTSASRSARLSAPQDVAISVVLARLTYRVVKYPTISAHWASRGSPCSRVPVLAKSVGAVSGNACDKFVLPPTVSISPTS